LKKNLDTDKVFKYDFDPDYSDVVN